MKKFSVLSVSILLIFAVLMTSCSSKDVLTGTKTATDNEGNSYSVVFDKSGFLKLGEKDGLIIADEKDGTSKTVAFPQTLTVENEIHKKFFKLKVPDGWQNSSDELAKIKYTKDSNTAEIIINERSSSLKACIDEIDGIMQPLENTVKNVDFNFANAVKLEYEESIIFYVFTVEGRTYFVRVMADEDLKSELNFEEIINTIQFRKGE